MYSLSLERRSTDLSMLNSGKISQMTWENGSKGSDGYSIWHSPAILKFLIKSSIWVLRDGKEARRAIAEVYQDLQEFMQALNQKDIGTLVFFARRREMETFRNSRVKTDGFLIRDLQDEIRSCFHLKEHVSLDRVSLVTHFGITKSRISSTHFSYTLPEKYRYLIKPHKAIGDAARMFLVDREFHQYPEKFGEQLTGHIEEYERRKVAEKPAPDGGNGQI